MTAAALVRDLAAFSVQIALVALAVAVLVTLVHIPARTRYHGLRLVLAVSLMAPWLLRSPEVPVTQTIAPPAGTASVSPVVPGQVEPSQSGVLPAPAPRIPEIPWSPIVLGVVLIGVAARGLWLLVGLNRLRRLTKAGLVIEEPEYTQLQEQIGARATIAQVMGLAQPATFGLRRPVVMLPDALMDAPPALRRAVVIHELFHVRRRDWLSVLGEEVVCTVLWFHPGILWLTSQIQLAREEIVDELTVQATGDRRSYMRALLAFADSGGLSPLDGARGRPAPAFARRRQLFHRILSVSKEQVMSRPRIVLSAAVLAAVVLAAIAFASSLFPIVRAGSVAIMPPSLIETGRGQAASALSLLAPSLIQAPAPAERRVALDQQTGAAVTPHQVTPENPIPRRTRGANPAWPPSFAGRPFHVLVQTLVTIDRGGAVIAVERGGCQIVERPGVDERNETVCDAFSDAAAAAVRQWRYERPVQAPLQFLVAVKFEPGSEPTIALSSSEWQRYVRETQESLRELSDRQVVNGTTELLRVELIALANQYRELERAYRLASERYRPGHPEVDVLRRKLERVERDLASLKEKLGVSSVASQELYAAAKEEYERARRALERAQAQLLDAELREAARRSEASRQPEPSVAFNVSPIQDAGASPLRSPSGRAPVRVGGAVTAPRVLKSVQPAYSAEAMEARLQGTVRLQALIDEQGRVADARVLTSLPLLDEQALAAAKQWEFAPALYNGQPVPVLVMIELEFNLRK